MKRHAFVAETPGPVEWFYPQSPDDPMEVEGTFKLEDVFRSEVVARLFPCGDDVRVGYVYDGKTFAPPETAGDDEVPPRKQFGFLDFVGLFTETEQEAIVSSTDPKVRLFLLMATNAAFIDLDDQRIKDGLAYLAAQKLVTGERVEKVLSGSPPG